MWTSRVGLVVGLLSASACTNDYDAFLEGAGGSGTAGAVTGTGATSASSADASSASGATTSASSSSTGGEGGSGGSGTTVGAGGGGGGSGGGAPLEGTDPCEGIQLHFDQDLFDEIEDGGELWDVFDDSGGTLDAGDGTLRVGLDESGGEAIGVLYTTEQPLSGCSVTTRILRVDGADAMDGLITAFVGAYGDWGEAEDSRRGFEVIVEREPPGDPSCEGGVRRESSADWDLGPEACDLDELDDLLRLRHTGDQLCFDAQLDGAPEFTVLRCVDAPPALDVALGARGFGDVEVVFAPVL